MQSQPRINTDEHGFFSGRNLILYRSDNRRRAEISIAPNLVASFHSSVSISVNPWLKLNSYGWARTDIIGLNTPTFAYFQR